MSAWPTVDVTSDWTHYEPPAIPYEIRKLRMSDFRFIEVSREPKADQLPPGSTLQTSEQHPPQADSAQERPQHDVAPSIDDQIDAWHDGTSAESLATQLGMTEAEYRQFVTGAPPAPEKQRSGE